MKEFDKVLDQDERVMWEDSPSFWPFFMGSAAASLIGLFWMTCVVFVAWGAFQAGGIFKYIIFFTPHFWIGIFLLFGPPIYALLVFKHTHYVITDKRVIFQKGVIGRDFDQVDFDQITNAQVNVGIFDKIFGENTGSILISTAGSFVATKHGAQSKPYTMTNIPNPYDAFKFLKQVSHDVKTDIQYPNQLRPQENPGYQTNYTEPKV